MGFVRNRRQAGSELVVPFFVSMHLSPPQTVETGRRTNDRPVNLPRYLRARGGRGAFSKRETLSPSHPTSSGLGLILGCPALHIFEAPHSIIQVTHRE